MTIGVLFFLSVLMTSCVTGGDDSPSEKEIQTSESHEFVAIMDMPYSAYQEKILKEQIIPAIDHRFSFVMHLGDFKSGDIDCTIEGMQDSLAMIYGIKPGQVVYTPGDNDWADCDRKRYKKPVSELGQLEDLRDEIEKHTKSSERKLPHWRRQQGFPENSMWTIGDVLYATFHIVGTNNARDKVNQDSVESAIKSVRKREVSLKKWFDYTAYRASLLEPKAIVIGFHADPWNPKQLRDYKGACRDGNRQKCDGLTFFRDLLREFLRKVKIPVLAVHGDSKGYCFNHPMDEMNEPNFWRINGPGDNRIFDALVVRVNPGAEQPFRPRGLLSSKALPLTEDCPVPDQPKEPE